VDKIFMVIKDSALQDFWNLVIQGLEQVLEKDVVKTWFGVLKPVEFHNHKIIIGAPNQFYIEWITQYYLSYLNEVISKLSNNQLVPEIVVIKSDYRQERILPVKDLTTETNRINHGSRIISRYTFENFVVGESNRLCFAASKAVADAPAKTYNPLFIYGGVGLGKTHLLHAIGNYVQQKYPSLKVYYTPAEEMFLDLIQSIQDRNPNAFNNKYRTLDLLLLDDIHYLKGKERLQEDVFHLFNHLHMMGKQIVFTSDRPPREIPTLEERLVSRLLSGMVCDLKPPDIETRIAILNNKAKQENIKIGPEVIFFIAENIKTNIRELEGALIRLNGYASLTNTPITLEIAKEVLSDFVTHKPLPKPIKILEIVANHYNLTIEELRSKERTQRLALARQVAMYFLRSVGGLSLKEIGSYLGGKDHSTVIHAIEKITKMKSQDELLSKDIEQIAMLINGG
jgi:chromosomal replication initiator protein